MTASPRTVTALNASALVVALASVAFVARCEPAADAGRAAGPSGAMPSLVDASGTEVPIRPYRRIVAASPVADHLVVSLCERDRILAVSGHARPSAMDETRFSGIPVFDRLSDVEALVALGPDLVVVNNYVTAGALAQLRGAGLEVFELGEMRGLETFLEDARTLSTLVGERERGERFARAFEARMRAVAADVPEPSRPRAMYLGTQGVFFYGGAGGTSYHDVLVYGGLRDAAAGYVGWPSFTSEQILELDPEIVVTSTGTGAVLCRRPGLDRLRPCRGEGRIVELPEELLFDPGMPMLDAAEALRRAVHGEPPSPEPGAAERAVEL